jgi:hypothetical protein
LKSFDKKGIRKNKGKLFLSPIEQNPIEFECLTTSSDDSPREEKFNPDIFGLKASGIFKMNQMLTVENASVSDVLGHLKKISLYCPQMKLFKIEEFPIFSRQQKQSVKDYIINWESKLNSFKGFTKIHSTHWNQPEGCVSVI